MAKLKAIVTSLDEVPEVARPHYVEQADGTYHVDVEGIEHHPAVGALANAKTRVDQLAAQRQQEIAALRAKIPPTDFTVEEWERLRALDEAREPARALARTARLAELDAELERLRGWIDRRSVDAELRDALVEVGCRAQLLSAAIAMLRDKVRVVKRGDDGLPVLRTRHAHLRLDQFVKRWSRTPEGQEFVAQRERVEPSNGFAAVIRGFR